MHFNHTVRIIIIPVSAVMSVYLTGQRKSRLQKSNIVLKLKLSDDSVYHQIAKLYKCRQ